MQARIVNTSSGAGLLGSVGQGNYAAAKAGIAALTQVAAAELGRYGMTVNAIAPAARTPMTEAVFAEAMRAPEAGLRRDGPGQRLAAGRLAGERRVRRRQRPRVRGRGRRIGVVDGWRFGPAREAGRALGPGRARRRSSRELIGQAPDARPGLRRE